MKFFYSGASCVGADQTNPELSLGGFVSDTVIPNDLLQNIFSIASSLSIQQNKRETRMIVLQNDDVIKAINLILSFNINADTISKYQIAFVTPNDEGCFEQISNTAALPYNGVFEPITPTSTFNLPNLNAGEYLGIWITRTYDFTSCDLKHKSKDWWQKQLQSFEDESINADPEDENENIVDFTIPVNTQDELDLVLDYDLE